MTSPSWLGWIKHDHICLRQSPRWGWSTEGPELSKGFPVVVLGSNLAERPGRTDTFLWVLSVCGLGWVSAASVAPAEETP